MLVQSVQLVYAFIWKDVLLLSHVCVTWETNKTRNWQVMFRASNDSVKTFGDQIDLSNKHNYNSLQSGIASGENNDVYVVSSDKNWKLGSNF